MPKLELSLAIFPVIARTGSYFGIQALEKNYGKEGAEIITDNTQITMFGGFAPNSESAQVLSKALGSRTVQSGSVSRGKNDPSQSLQMIERALMTPDELKSMPKGRFIVMKTGFYPMQVKLKLFYKWGIRFGDPYTLPERGNREVKYAGKADLQDEIFKRYYSAPGDEASALPDAGSEDGGGMAQTEINDPQKRMSLRTQKPNGT